MCKNIQYIERLNSGITYILHSIMAFPVVAYVAERKIKREENVL
jgi:hypothetical protein